VFFHILTILWRVLLFLHYGRPDESVNKTWYIIWKSSAAGDLGNTLSAICVYLRYITQKFKHLKETENMSLHEMARVPRGRVSMMSYYSWMWVAIVLYSTFWGYLLMAALDAKNLAFCDKVMTYVIAAFAVVIAVQLRTFYCQIRIVMGDHFDQVAFMLRKFSFMLVTALLIQAVLIPLTSTNFSPTPEKIGSNGWDEILGLQCAADLIVSILIVSSIYVMYQTDTKADLCLQPPERKSLTNSNNSYSAGIKKVE
jgi:hypothetical protein